MRRLCLIILGVEVIAQLLQFAFGVTPGDDLSGLFGKNGTGNAFLFEILVCCVFFGHWITTKQWTGLLAALFMSMVSSVLGEMKIFAAAITIIGLMAAFLYAIKYRAPGKTLFYLTLIFIVLISFVSLYNNIIPGADKTPIQTFITNPARLLKYLNFTSSSNKGGNVSSYLGRLDAIRIGWDSIKKDPITLLFGFGLGTRNESQTLGTTGAALTRGSLGVAVGTSMLVMMQEMGIIGLALLAGFLLWILLTMVHDIRVHPESPAIGLRYALLLFSILWPVWLWYATTWTMRVPMLLYWMLLGYVLAESRQLIAKIRLHSRKEAG